MTASRERLAFAKVFVEVAAVQELPDHIEARLESGQICRVEVSYDWKPPRCQQCKCFGHEPVQCPIDPSKRLEKGCGRIAERDGPTYEAEPSTHSAAPVSVENGVSPGGVGTERDGPTYASMLELEFPSVECEKSEAGEEAVTGRGTVDLGGTGVGGGENILEEGGGKGCEEGRQFDIIHSELIGGGGKRLIVGGTNNDVLSVQDATKELPSKAIEPFTKAGERRVEEELVSTLLKPTIPPEPINDFYQGELPELQPQASHDRDSSHPEESSASQEVHRARDPGKKLMTADVPLKTVEEEFPKQLTKENEDWQLLQEQAHLERTQKMKKKGNRIQSELVSNSRVTRSKS